MTGAGASIHPIITSLKTRASALWQHGDRLYVGLASGALQVYSYDLSSSGEGSSESRGLPQVKLIKTHNLSRRSIDQIGVLPETNQLVVLADSTVTLYTLPEFGKTGTMVLAQARTAHCFDIASYTTTVKSKPSKGDLTASQPESTKVRRDMLVVGCRKRVVVYGPGKSGYKDGLELNLPHSPRTVIIPSGSGVPDTVHMLYSTTTSAILRIDTTSKQPLTVTDLPNAPLPTSSGPQARDTAAPASSTNAESSTAGGLGGAFSGLGGYVGLGGKAAVPVGTRTFGGEVLLGRQEQGGFYSSEGNFTRQESIQWPTALESIAFASPYIYSLVGTPPSPTNPTPSPSINVHLGPTLLSRQPITLPSPSAGGLAISSLVPTTSKTSTAAEALADSTRLLFISTPTDKTLLQNEGSSIWALRSGDVGEQVDELVKEGHSADAIGLVEAVGEGGLPTSRRLAHLKTLNAVCQFAKGLYQPAMDSFLVFNVNPALVISLFPAETISGPLHVSRDKWLSLFGAVDGARLEPPSSASRSAATDDDAKSILRIPHLGLRKKESADTLRQETGSVASDTDKPAPPMTGDEQMAPRAALEALMYYLSDRRQKLTGAITTNGLPSESSVPPLSSLDASELHALPSVPMTELEPEQLLRMAQIIYTALLKVYLVARPILVGSLCRIENWCDVHEVEGLLKAQKKFSDLIDLYQGKKMHGKALTMLEELAKEEDDPLDRYPPIIRYLQKLGPDHLQTIFDHSKWIFTEDPNRAVTIFTADEPEVEALPRKEVVEFLAGQNKDACIVYLEHAIDTLEENDAEFHDRLAELYLEKAKKDESIQTKLVEFLEKSQHYRANRLLGKIKGEDMPRVKALLLGRMGRHDEALRIYVSRLEDFASAELYCSRIYSSSNPDLQDKSIFLLLLKIYLLPQNKDKLLLAPALSLLANHSTQLDPAAVLEILPPLVTMEEIRSFLIRTMRDGTRRINDRKIIKSIVSSRKEEVERILMGLEVKRVRITDQRICPQCQKRLGQSAIAVHAPRGEVTHLHCKDPFSAKLAKIRG